MGLLTDDQIQALRIEKFIFHIVQHGKDEPLLLEETPIGDFEDFFLLRVRDTLLGNRFIFNSGSNTLKLLNELNSHPENFVKVSQDLAVDFHTRQSKRIKPGVMILIQLCAGDITLYSIIKYDHEEVVTYKVDGHKAIMQAIANSFTKTKESLHKSALVMLSETGGEVIVIDRKVSYDISDFFKGFLNVRRKFENNEMTKVVNDIIIQTASLHRDTLPPDLTRNIRTKSFAAIDKSESFNSDDHFTKVFGPHGNEAVKKTYDHLLAKRDLDGESFKFDKEAVKPPRIRKYKTREGVKVEFSDDAKDTVVIQSTENDQKTIITITTDKLTEY